MAKLGAQRLQTTLDDLARMERGGARERAALAGGLDDWVPFDDAIHASDPTLPTAGYSLGAVAGGRAWLVPGGRLLTIPDDPTQPGRLGVLSDEDVDGVQLARKLRAAAITNYVGGVALAELTGPAVPVVVADLLQIVWDMGADGRVAVFEALAGAMRPADGWDQAAVRLKGGFEQGLSDRTSPVRVVAARALVRMAVGLGPVLPMADPTRIVGILFMVPYRDVHVATLGAVDALEPALLARLAPVLEPHLRAAAADPDPETRRLVAALELRLVGRPEADALAADLASPESRVRVDALRHLAEGPPDLAEAFLARVLDCTADPDAEVRQAAAGVLVPLLERAPAATRARVLSTLLLALDPRLGRAALEYLTAHPALDAETERAVRLALDGPEANRAVAATVLCTALEHAPIEAAVEAYLGLLRHRDPVVRQAALRHLVAHPPERLAVREELLGALVEHLRDPEPTLRVETARAVLALGYPQAPELVGQLAFDPDMVARRGGLAVLREAGDPAAVRHAEQLAAHVDTLLALPRPGDGDARVRWLGALEAVSLELQPRVVDLLLVVLSAIPADTADPFLRQAIDEIDERLLARAEDPADFLSLCRRLLEPPYPQPDHASRLASRRAADDPAALTLLWTLYTQADGSASEAGRRGLAAMAAQPKSAAVRSELDDLLAHTEDPARRDVLRTLLAGDAPLVP
jgi:hypothetical protein